MPFLPGGKDSVLVSCSSPKFMLMMVPAQCLTILKCSRSLLYVMEEKGDRVSQVPFFPPLLTSFRGRAGDWQVSIRHRRALLRTAAWGSAQVGNGVGAACTTGRF